MQPLRDVLSREGFLQQYAALFANDRWPSAQDVAEATAFLARDRAERQGRLL